MPYSLKGGIGQVTMKCSLLSTITNLTETSHNKKIEQFNTTEQFINYSLIVGSLFSSRIWIYFVVMTDCHLVCNEMARNWEKMKTGASSQECITYYTERNSGRYQSWQSKHASQAHSPCIISYLESLSDKLSACLWTQKTQKRIYYYSFPPILSVLHITPFKSFINWNKLQTKLIDLILILIQ